MRTCLPTRAVADDAVDYIRSELERACQSDYVCNLLYESLPISVTSQPNFCSISTGFTLSLSPPSSDATASCTIHIDARPDEVITLDPLGKYYQVSCSSTAAEAALVVAVMMLALARQHFSTLPNSEEQNVEKFVVGKEV
jgi:hypothetical protein